MQGLFTIICVNGNYSALKADENSLRSFFSQAKILTAEDYAGASKHIEKIAGEKGPVVVVTDAYFHSESKRGFDLVCDVHKKYPAIPFIFYLGRGDDNLFNDRLRNLGIRFIERRRDAAALDLAIMIEDAEMNGPGSGHHAQQRRIRPGAAPAHV